MFSYTQLLSQGTAHAWLFVPSAVLLGALHGLEPGHSKTMMAAFIVAIRGTVAQAVLLGLATTLSHTAIVWIVALIGLKLGGQFSSATTEPYFQLASGIAIIAIALWMMLRIRRERAARHSHAEHHADGHDHAHADDHEREHAADIEKRFSNRSVTTGQLLMFGLTGGLIPCPASITVLLICLQLKKFSLGIVLVLCFSIGLALTMVLSGTLAALSVRHLTTRWSGFGRFAERAPYASIALIVLVGCYTSYAAWHAIATAS
jgi:nickel/cobalt transporter (NicO) family protein